MTSSRAIAIQNPNCAPKQTAPRPPAQDPQAPSHTAANIVMSLGLISTAGSCCGSPACCASQRSQVGQAEVSSRKLKNTLLRVIPAATLFCHSFWHLIWKSIPGTYFLTFYSGILFWHWIWRSLLKSGSAQWDLELAVEVRQCPLSWGPAICTEIWSWQLGGGGGGGRRGGGGGGEEGASTVTLIKSRDPHLAGGEQQETWNTHLKKQQQHIISYSWHYNILHLIKKYRSRAVARRWCPSYGEAVRSPRYQSWFIYI